MHTAAVTSYHRQYQSRGDLPPPQFLSFPPIFSHSIFLEDTYLQRPPPTFSLLLQYSALLVPVAPFPRIIDLCSVLHQLLSTQTHSIQFPQKIRCVRSSPPESSTMSSSWTIRTPRLFIVLYVMRSFLNNVRLPRIADKVVKSAGVPLSLPPLQQSTVSKTLAPSTSSAFVFPRQHVVKTPLAIVQRSLPTQRDLLNPALSREKQKNCSTAEVVPVNHTRGATSLPCR